MAQADSIRTSIGILAGTSAYKENFIGSSYRAGDCFSFILNSKEQLGEKYSMSFLCLYSVNNYHLLNNFNDTSNWRAYYFGGGARFNWHTFHTKRFVNEISLGGSAVSGRQLFKISNQNFKKSTNYYLFNHAVLTLSFSTDFLYLISTHFGIVTSFGLNYHFNRIDLTEKSKNSFKYNINLGLTYIIR